MGQVRHGSATIEPARRHRFEPAVESTPSEQQYSDPLASLAQLSRELGINPKTVAKWRKRAKVEDSKTGPTEPRSTVLTEAEEAMVVALRRHTLQPLDDCLCALQPPGWTRTGAGPDRNYLRLSVSPCLHSDFLRSFRRENSTLASACFRTGLSADMALDCSGVCTKMFIASQGRTNE